MTADLLFHGGRIYSFDPEYPAPGAVAVQGGRIAAVGSRSELAGLVGARTEFVDLDGRTLLPGFYDAHQHQIYAGLARRSVDARADSIASLVERFGDMAARTPDGAWLEGGGYDESRFAEGRHPTRDDLDKASLRHPAFVTRTCGHAMVVNSRALVAAGIDSDTPDPAGGTIVRAPGSRQPTGLLHERAMELVRRVVPKVTAAALESAILGECARNLRLGITSLWEPSVEPDHVEAYLRLEDEGRLPLRVTMAHKKVLRSGEEVPLPTAFRRDRLSLVGVKLFQDGAIGARTAALSGAYAGDDGNHGLLIWEQERLDSFVEEIHAAGLQVSIHAIGDAAIASALRAIERAQHRSPAPGLRHRIEHCGLPIGSLPKELAAAGVIGVLQPVFLHFHGDNYQRQLGPSASPWLYPAKTLMDAGVRVAFSSDAPVVPDWNPLLGVKTAMLRRTAGGDVVAGEAVSLEEALRAYTLGGAVAAGEEARKGSLTPGKVADLVVLEEDITEVDAEALDGVGVERVFVDGVATAV